MQNYKNRLHNKFNAQCSQYLQHLLGIALHCWVNYLLLFFGFLLLYESGDLCWLMVSRSSLTFLEVFSLWIVFFTFAMFRIQLMKTQSETIISVTLVFSASIITINVYDSKELHLPHFIRMIFHLKFFDVHHFWAVYFSRSVLFNFNRI